MRSIFQIWNPAILIQSLLGKIITTFTSFLGPLAIRTLNSLIPPLQRNKRKNSHTNTLSSNELLYTFDLPLDLEHEGNLKFDNAANQEMLEWCRKTFTPVQLEYIVGEQLHEFSTKYFVFITDKEKAFALHRFCIALWFLDENVELNHSYGRKVIEAVEKDDANSDDLYIRVMMDSIHDICKHYSHKQAQRFKFYVIDYFKGISVFRVARSFDDYKSSRVSDIANYIFMHLACYATNMDIEDIWEDYVDNFVVPLGINWGLWNDLFSYGKELYANKQQDKSICNSVKLFMELNNCSIQDAVNEVVRQIEVHQEIIDQTFAKSPKSLVFKQMYYVIKGNIVFSLMSRRYNTFFKVDNNKVMVYKEPVADHQYVFTKNLFE